jgi:hypothetical protein
LTITYPLDIPLEEFSEVEIARADTTSIQRSTFSGKDRVQEFEGDWWVLTLSYRNLSEQLGRELSAFGTALRGPLGTFVVRYPGYSVSLGTAGTVSSAPLVNGAGQAGSRVLSVKSAPADQVDWLKAGDIIQVGPDTRPHWHEVLADVDTGGSGLASIDVWPAIRQDVINNDPIVTANPKCLCRLTTSFAAGLRAPILYDITFEARESVP